MTIAELIHELQKLPRDAKIRYLDFDEYDYKPDTGLDFHQMNQTGEVGIDFPTSETKPTERTPK